MIMLSMPFGVSQYLLYFLLEHVSLEIDSSHMQGKKSNQV